jgi:hypothetical protein
MILSAPARADFGIVPGSFTADVFKQDGVTLETQAGGHPYSATTRFSLNTFNQRPDGHMRDIATTLPAGFIGNPEATPKCSREDFDALIGGAAQCPASSQVGLAEIDIALGDPGPPSPIPFVAPVYNLVPVPGTTAEFGIPIITVPVHVLAAIDTAGNYRVKVLVNKVSQGLPVTAQRLTLWGVPSDPSHDNERFCGGAFPTGSPCPVGAPRVPFLTNPTSCAGPQTSTLSIDSWENPGAFANASYTTSVGVDGCDRVPFDPNLTAQPDTSKAGAPAGLSVDLNLPQSNDPDGIATAHLRRASVTLPDGMTISPSAADGLQGCSDAQVALTSAADVTCPTASKIGTVEVTTPVLHDHLKGNVYLGTQASDDPASGQMYRIFLVAKGSGVTIKLPGSIVPDAQTGRLTATFDDNPQLPFSNLHLEFKGGPRAPLSNPPTCGTKTTSYQLTSWSGKTVNGTDSFDVSKDGHGAPCPASQPLASGFQAGTIDPIAGALTPFTLTASRTDLDQEIGSINASLPQGLLGKIAGIPLCDGFHAAQGTCSDASLVGHTTVGAGAGSNPFFLGGKVFLTGPYKGGPYGLSIVVPAIAGPFNLGDVVTRAAIHVDLHTAALSVTSDPLPTILKGVPLHLRTINVLMDRPGFMFNPTNCTPTTVGGQLISPLGGVANVSNRFQVGECSHLPFAPKITFAIGRKGHVGVGRSTPLTVTLTQKAGEAANKRVAVILPINLAAEQGPLQTECTPAQYAADKCPAASRVGTAYAYTPVLSQRLLGPVYFVNVPGQIYPKLAAELNRDGVKVNLEGQITLYKGNRLKTVFGAVPDVPISKFVMALVDGKRGPLAVTHNMCTAKKPAVDVALDAQSGKRVAGKVALKITGCPKAKRK